MEHVSREPFRRLNALLDRHEGDGDDLPPLGHWLCFLPPIPLPMRMWAGSRLTFHAPIPYESEITRRSTILDLKEKQGRTGPLAFLTVRHEIFAGHTLGVTDELDVVFRDRSGEGRQAAGETRTAEVSRIVAPTSALLFRYSALTFNAHRIHYDREYAQKTEGYPGLVVHGPLQATLLVDHFRRQRPNDPIRTVEFRAFRPVYDLAPFSLNYAARQDGAELWTNDAEGYVAMSARVTAGGAA